MNDCVITLHPQASYNMKSYLLKPYAHFVRRQVRNAAERGVLAQQEIMGDLVRTARDTAYGKDHDFASIRNYEDFKARVPIGDYEFFNMDDDDEDILH